MKVIQTEYGTSKDILFNLDPYTARPIMVEDDNVKADANGRKIVKAGSLLDANGVVKNDATVRYVLLKDIDVTYGPAAGTGVYRGTIDKAKLPVAPAAEAVTALKGIIFMSDEDLNY